MRTKVDLERRRLIALTIMELRPHWPNEKIRRMLAMDLDLVKRYRKEFNEKKNIGANN